MHALCAGEVQSFVPFGRESVADPQTGPKRQSPRPTATGWGCIQAAGSGPVNGAKRRIRHRPVSHPSNWRAPLGAREKAGRGACLFLGSEFRL
jgi:hypothetical protein